MNIIKSVKNLTEAERRIWIISLTAIILSSFLFGNPEILTLTASLIGATALIFVAKGDALGQLFTIIFGVIYAVISYRCRYYGEMITYLGMTAPSALWAMIVWLKNPYSEREVKVGGMTKIKWLVLLIGAASVTALMYKVLEYFNTASLLFSTVSVTTSFLASMLTVLRSPYYALFYALNDIVLIILWVIAAAADISCLPMVICFMIFLVNDLYGFFNWRRMKNRQKDNYQGKDDTAAHITNKSHN